LNQEEIDLLSLGLNFQIAPRYFPIEDHIKEIESLCHNIEHNDASSQSIEKSQKIRNVAVNFMRKFKNMKIKSNLSNREWRILKELKEDKSIIITSADKGAAVCIEDKTSYLKKCQDQLKSDDYILSKASANQILLKLQKKILMAMKELGISKLFEKRRYTVSDPVSGSQPN